jgi:hypothetical protein
MVVAVIALIVALSGSAIAASGIIIKRSSQLGKNVVTSKQVKNGSLSGSDLSLASIGTVPAASNAVHANVADRASSIPSPEGFHLVGAPGEPSFQNGWNNVGTPYATMAYWKDLEGVVHLRGSIAGGISPTAFTLPAGYRPSGRLGFAILGAGGNPPVGTIAVDSSGTVGVNSGVQPFALDAISFRAEQ